ncbi:MAG: alpha/beta hydrolase [Rhodoferax sp.]|jgi:pimeloyl-ACP methyl ester carboxylesterase|uniref:alpha/beta fold hydrolase n=1 Tax=Rhodoferax sp. TaxID=50421 RepID=UPI001B4894F9|nr:alpha/beta hydrolase [Rhodoferax sp.]MBP9148999.1 alpha/beta hydrolase [Rhodoferax sp.]MBP9735174.1 alpha/beta hydrolase [Rhodoferax sp.]
MQTLMLLPGLMCDAEVWAQQVHTLAAQADVVVVDYGHCNNLPDMARAVLAQAPSGPLAVAGHSMGGRVALELVRMVPQRISHLALLNMGAHPLPAGEAGAKESEGRLALVALAQRRGMRAMGAHWARGMVHPDRLATPLFESVLDMLERSSPDQFAAQTHALIHRPDASDVLAQIVCPTLVLTGRQDLWSPPEQHARIAAAIKGARLLILEHCGHMSTMEQGAEVSSALSELLHQSAAW